MITFKQYIIEQMTVREYTGSNGFYAWLNVAQDSQEDMLATFPELKLTADELAQLHVTVMYSKTAISTKYVDENKKMPDPTFIQAVGVIGFEWWAGHDGDGYLVMKLNPDNIKQLHEKWKKCGAVPTFEDYKPHMTLKTPISEGSGKELANVFDFRVKKSGGFQVTLIQEQVEDLKK